MKRNRVGVERFLEVFAIAFFSLSILFLVYAVLFANKALPNTYFASIGVAGKSQAQISNIVNTRLGDFGKQKLRIMVGDTLLEFSPEELGVKFSSNASRQKVYDVSIAENPIDDYWNRLSALFITKSVSPIYSIDKSKLNSSLDKALVELEKKAVNSTISFESGEPKIIKDEKGVVLDRSRLIGELVKRLDNLSNEPIVALYIVEQPLITANGAQVAFEKAKLLNEQSIVLSYEFDSWSLSGETLSDLLKFYPESRKGGNVVSMYLGDNPIVLEDISFKSKQALTLEVQLDAAGLSLLVDEISSVVDKATVDATLEFDGVKVSKFTPAQDGQILDKQLAQELILNVVSVNSLNIDSEVTIKLPVKVSKARIANEQINSLGIKELIASGISYFQGSIPNRAFNIGLGSQFINGTVVPPGEVFSFNKLVGPVSSQQGFKEAYVISKGRTVLDDGGGICQVSTTVFRAALNAGLPIVERTAHAYRVTYYEQRGFEPGYDATIWSPTVDLKFRNDTAHHILVQAIVDTSQSKLQIDIYGTSDGRKIELTSPVLTNKRPAPEPLYQDDPSLATGVIKQVDWAAQGLTSVFTRKVYRGDEVLIDESIKSNFRPWQAVYLVGTGT